MRLLTTTVLVLALVAPLPAFAGAKETALLARYAGTWTAHGSVSGPHEGPVDCSLTFTSASGGKLSYSGDCEFDKGKTGFRGTIIYNDSAKRYETAGTGQGVNVSGFGKASGNSISFSVKNVETTYGIASSDMTLAGSSIKLSFSLKEKKGTTAANLTFKK